MTARYTIQKITLTCEYCGKRFFRQKKQWYKVNGVRVYRRIWMTRDQVKYCCPSHRVMAYQKRRAYTNVI